jgi:hypothetical protein
MYDVRQTEMLWRRFMDNMEPKNVRYPPLLLEKLSAMAQERGIKETELMRRALDEFIQRWETSGHPK